MKLTDLVSIPPSTVYGFFNHERKVCQIFWSNSTLQSISKNTDEYRNIITRDELELNIIETCGRDLRLRHAYWCDHYKSKGYTFYKEPRKLVYKVKYELARDPLSNRMIWFVYLENRVPQKVIVGAFKTFPEMKQFIKSHYPSRNIYEITYDSGELTNKIRAVYEG